MLACSQPGQRSWLAPIREALDRCAEPRAIFVRNDDVGWGWERLERLIALTRARRLPLDLAVIPAALTNDRARWLLDERGRHTARIGLHQHGYAHVNHEGEGARKSEFGSARSPELLATDLHSGQQRLADLLPDALDPVFTPPWNRCASSLGPLLVAAGITILSRDTSAPPLETRGLIECPTTCDWFAKSRGVPVGRAEWGQLCAKALSDHQIAGLLFHHGATEDEEWPAIEALLDLLCAHSKCRFVSLLEAATLVESSGTPARTEATPWT